MFIDKIHGEMLGLSEAAAYLAVSRRKFRRLAPKAIVFKDCCAFWPRRILDTISTEEEFDNELTLERGRQCGKYLISELNDEEISKLRERVLFTRSYTSIRPAAYDECTCGRYNPEQTNLQFLFADLGCTCVRRLSPEQGILRLLDSHGVRIRFCSPYEVRPFRDGILGAIKQYIRDRISQMQADEARKYLKEYWAYLGWTVRDDQ